MSRRLSFAHAYFGLWLIRTGRKLTDRGFEIVEYEIARWKQAEAYMTESEEAEADAGFVEIHLNSATKNVA